MKKLLSVLLVTSVSANAAIAGNFDTPLVLPPDVEAPAAQDWGGFYLGGLFAFETGDWDVYIESRLSSSWAIEGKKYGAFAGYNIQRNNLVFGGELAYSTGDITSTRVGEPTTAEGSETFFDAKVRLGYALDNVLIYGVAGGTVGDSTDGFDGADLWGFNYGAGAQMKFGNGLFVGVEYLIRDLEGVNVDESVVTFDYVNQSIALRAGMQF